MEALVTGPNRAVWKGRKVFMTGHTGFKGGWMSLWLAQLGAHVRGYALDPCTDPNLLDAAKIPSVIDDIRGNILDLDHLKREITAFQPEIVIHMAAQPLVRYSYEDPLGTYSTNVLGTAHLLEAARAAENVRAVVSVTTDKCYENKEWVWGYRETDPLGGYDPYSSSKACSEIVTAAYRQSFFNPAHFGKTHQTLIASGRAGNVIGGGDWSLDRLIPDLVRGFLADEDVKIRRPHSIRPWQHVLEPLWGYMRLAEELYKGNVSAASGWNFGPTDDDAWPVGRIADKMVSVWGDNAKWVQDGDPGPHEAGYLKLDASKARMELGWKPNLRIGTTLEWLVDWYKQWQAGADMHKLTLEQISAYEKLIAGNI
ncbi:MAG: CDP-glucose 4,6-dehydratase [Acidobacteria bacterium]|nr:CDP-glucose 4,6-dehydratase [Acidobacteriota bacterium]